MARYDRNRGMFLGSWTGKDIPASIDINVSKASGSSVTATLAQGGLDDFASKVPTSGEYGFTYTGSKWELNGEPVVIADYGITVSGTAKAGDLIDVNYTKASGGWEALGKDNDNLTKDLNPDTEKSKNVLGESTFRHTGYEPEISLDPYYIDPSRKMYKRMMKNAIVERYAENELKGYFAEAFFTTANKETRTMTGYCFVREAWYVPQSTGGDTAAYGIPVTITPVGAITRKKIVYDMETNEGTISALAANEIPIVE